MHDALGTHRERHAPCNEKEGGMPRAMQILHGEYGRAMLITLDRSVTVQAHRTGQLLFKIDGADIKVTVRDRSYQLRDDHVILVNAWEPYSYEIAEDFAGVTILALYLNPAWLKCQDPRFSCSMNPRFFSVPYGAVPSTARPLVDELIELIACEIVPTSRRLEALAIELTAVLSEKYSDSKRLSSFETVGGISCDARIRRVLAIMRETVGEPVVIEQLAKLARMSRPHFFHVFKQQTQLTPMLYSSMVRMEAAIKEISETTDSLYDISLRLGFESPGNFTRFFKMHQGIAPSQYRRNVTILSETRPVHEPVILTSSLDLNCTCGAEIA